MSAGVFKLFPLHSSTLFFEVLVVTILAFVAAKFMKAPLSLSMALVGLLLGLSTSRHLPVDYTFVSTIIVMWLLAPIISLASAFFLERAMIRTRPENIWRRIKLYKFLLIIAGALASYALGANTVGLIVALGGYGVVAELVAVVATLIGSLALSDREINRVGEDMFSLRYSTAFGSLLIATALVEFATLFSIPMSSTQTLSAAVTGTAVSSVHKLISLRPFLVIVAAWVVVPAGCYVIGNLL